MSVPTLPIHVDTASSVVGLDALRQQVLGLGAQLKTLNAQFGSTAFADPMAGLSKQMAQDIAEIKSLLGTKLKEAVASGAAAVKAGNAQVLSALKQSSAETKTAIEAAQEALVTKSKAGKKIKLADVDAEADVARIKSAAAAVQVAMRTARADGLAFSSLSSGAGVNSGVVASEFKNIEAQYAALQTASDTRLAKEAAGVVSLTQLKKASNTQLEAEYDQLFAAAKARNANLSASEVALTKHKSDQLALQNAAQEKALARDLSGYRTMLDLKVAAEKKASLEIAADRASALKRSAELATTVAKTSNAPYSLYSPGASSNGTVVNATALKAMQEGLKDTEDKLKAVRPYMRGLTLDMNDAHAAARGLAGGFGQLWLTYGSVLPLVAGAALAASFVKSLQAGAAFVESLYVIRELAGNTGEQVQALSNSALELGRTSQYGPVEVAKGMEILALAGLKASEVLSAIKPTLNFASAGGVSTEKAAETLVAVSTAYGYSAAQFAVVGDVISKSAADSMASVESMSESFKSSSVVAQQYGVTLQDMSTNLMFLAQIGIKGTAAGTSVRNMYAELAKGSGKVAAALVQLGVQAQDGNGKMRPLMETMEQMVLATANLSGKSANNFFQDISNERGGKDLAAIYAGVYKVINDNEAKRLASSAEGTKSVYETVEALQAQGKVTEANALKVKTLKEGFDQMNQEQQTAAENTAGFAFFADLEKQLTPLTQYKKILASLQTDFVEAFTGAEAAVDGSNKAINGAQDGLYLLGNQLKKIADSEGFRQAMANMVSALTSFLSTIISVGEWLSEHQKLLSSLALFYVTYRVAVAAAAAQTVIFSAVQVASAGVMSGVLRSSLVSSAVSLYATAEAYAAARGAALAFQLTVLTFGVAAVAAAGYAAYLAAKYLFLAESAEEAAQRTRDADVKNLKSSTEANAARISQTLEAVKEDNDRYSKLEELRAKGITGEIATVKVAGDAAMARIEFNRAEAESLAKRTLEQRQANLAVAQSAADKATEYGRFIPILGAPIVAAAVSAQQVLINQGKQALVDYETSVAEIRLGAAVSLADTSSAFDKKVSNAKEEQARANAAAEAAGKRFTGLDEFGGGEGKDAKTKTLSEAKAHYDRLLSLEGEYYRDHKKTLDDGFKQEQDAIKGAVGARELTESQGFVKSLASTVAYEKAQSDLIEGIHNDRIAKLDELDAAFSGGAKAYDKFLDQHLDEEAKAANRYKESKDQLTQLVAARKAAASVLLSKTLSDDSEAFKKANTELAVYNQGLELKAQADREAAGMSADARAGFEAQATYLAKFAKEQETLTAILENQKAAAQTLGVALMDAQLAGQTEALPELKDRFDKVTLAVASSTDQLSKYNAALTAGGNKAALDATNKELIKQFDETNAKIKGGIADAIFNGAKDGASGLKDQLRKAILDFSKQKFRFVIDAVLNPISGAITSFINPAAGAAASVLGGGGGGGGLGSLLSLGNSASGFGTSIATSIGSTLANVLPGSISSALGLSSTSLIASNAALVGGGASATAAATAAGAAGNAGFLSGISGAIGAIPVWGQIALGLGSVAAAFGLFGKKKPESRGTGNSSVSYDAYGNRTSTSFQAGAGGTSEAVDTALASMVKGYLDGTKLLGLSARASTFAVGGHGTPGEKDQKFRISGGSNTDKAYADSGVQAATPEAMTLAANRAVFAALAGSDLPRQLAGLFDGQDFNTVTQEGIDAVIRKGVALNQLDVALNALPLANLANLSYTAADGLITAAGGIEALASGVAGYYSNFFTQEEQKNQKIKDINSALSGTGFDAATGTRASFRALFESQDANTVEGQKFIAAMLRVQGIFASITPEIDAAGGALTALSDAMRRLLDERASLEVSLLRAQGNTTGADAAQYAIDTADLTEAEKVIFDYNAGIRRQITVLDEAKTLQDQYNDLTLTSAQRLALQRDALDESNRALFDNIQAEKARQAEEARLKAVAEQRGQLEIQIMELQGNSAGALAARRALEIAALDETLQPLQRVIYGLQDMAAASNAAGAAYFAAIDRDKAVASNIADGQAALDKFFGTTADAGNAALEAANASQAAAKTAAAAWRSAGDSIRATLAKVNADTVKVSGNSYASSWADFQSLTVLARGGDTDSAGKLGGAADAFLEASKANSATLLDYLRDRSKVSQSLADTLRVVDAATSVQDAIANSSAAAVAQLTAMNANLTGYAAQLFELLRTGYQGADQSTASGVSARFAAANADFENYFSTTQSGSSRSFAGGTLQRLDGNLAKYTGADGRVDFIRAGESLLDVGKRIGAFRAQWEQQYGLNLPSYAVGTNYVPRDTFARIHEGEAIIPKAYNPAAGGRAPIGGADNAMMTRLLDRLDQRLSAVEDNTRAAATHGAKTARLLDRVTLSGTAMLTTPGTVDN